MDVTKSLEELENIYWGDAPKDSSSLVKKCHELRRKKLVDFEIGDLRILIGQEIGLNYLVPIALEHLMVNPFVEGDYYEGDLLQNVLKCSCDFWTSNKNYYDTLLQIVLNAEKKVGDIEDNTEEITDDILNQIKKFKNCKPSVR